MARHKIVTTNAEIDKAIEQARNLQNEPRVVGVEYRPGSGLDLLILKLSDGHRHLIPREDLEGLQSATKAQIDQVEILGNGTGLHWPRLDIDYYVPSLLSGIYGTQKWMAEIGRIGGLAKSDAKKQASRSNGMQGGRPRQKAFTTNLAIFPSKTVDELHTQIEVGALLSSRSNSSMQRSSHEDKKAEAKLVDEIGLWKGLSTSQDFYDQVGMGGPSGYETSSNY
jgi:hypothetical protein